ncbi:LLM class flavin-dependent oxidoreductase [Nocardia mikamii]|uniref:LLM class flavin-dependent oxidoreductase n=1 Tax=Nocardia mikamii TaxID=508464 RepID=UPI0007A3EF92|nr:LLM class flavin-dependent oxidoreductase [Nocardia mikamii]
MKDILFHLPVVGSYDQLKRGFAGVNDRNYQNMLWQISEQSKLADALGFWGVAFTEHHFHIEGFEESNNPILLDLYIGMQTERLRVGQLANVLPFQNPIRLAEDIAMLDHMTRGRAFTGIARGYQKRWADVLGQGYHVGATASDKSAQDQANRARFVEHWEIMKKLWTERTVSIQTENWQIPPANVEFGHEAVNLYGTGLDENGIVKEVGIAPKPYQSPYPPVFQPFSFSEESFRFCAREGIVPILMNTDETMISRLMDVYQEEAEASGHGSLKRGERIGIFRDVLVARDADEAHYWAERGNGFVFPAWFGPVGFSEVFRRQGETGSIGSDYATLRERGFEFVGTPDDVNRHIEKMVSQHGPEYLVHFQHSGPKPHDVQMRSHELYMTEVAPNWI